jgi:hypothetical protein
MIDDLRRALANPDRAPDDDSLAFATRTKLEHAAVNAAPALLAVADAAREWRDAWDLAPRDRPSNPIAYDRLAAAEDALRDALAELDR